MIKNKTKIMCSAAVAAIFAIAAIFGLWMLGSGFGVGEPVSLYIDADDNADSVRSKIEAVGEPDNMLSFSVFSTVLAFDEHIRTGRYEISGDVSMLQLIRHICNHNELPVNLVVPSHIRTMPEMASRLARHLMADSAEIAAVLTDSAELQALGYTRESAYALFVPNTYEVYWDMPVSELMARMKKEHDRFWTDERRAKLADVAEYAGLPFDEVAVVTLASIVDSETASNGEKAAIAGLYLNRLRIGMPLQSDPTVKFALQQFGLKRILHEHLTVDSPYNTYRNTGLPPGPICVPTIAGIDAVLNHARHSYLYMCAKEDFSGTHNFAVTYNEHLQNARRYTQALDRRGIR